MKDLTSRLDWHVPYLTSPLPGVGGAIRVEVEDFVVDEVPAYDASGEGEHTYLRIEKRDISTFDVMRQIAQQLNLPKRAVSSAGLKDARAVARQTLSIHGAPPSAVSALDLENTRILWVTRHRNKLRPGHLRGNRFTVRIRNVVPDAAARAETILDALTAQGVPNAYGPQRFGNHGDNHIAGYYLLHKDWEGLASLGIRHPSHRLRRFFIRALQSALFNQVLASRIEHGTMNTVVSGDVARKESTGGIFIVEDVTAEQPRAAAWEISATGPMYGYKMMVAQGVAGELESRTLACAGLTLGDFRSAKARGQRRPLRYDPEGTTYEMEEDGHMIVTFFAPKGSYATQLLAELMKIEAAR